MNRPKVGLVTVLYNSEGVLPGFYSSLGAQSYKNLKLYVIDNLSSDKSLAKSKEYASQFNIETVHIENPKNLGVAAGNNQGIKAALADNCEFVLLLNNDIEFVPETIERMAQIALQNNEKIIAPKIYYYGSNKIWSAGGRISKIRGMTFHFGDKMNDIGQFDQMKYVEYAPTCFLLIDARVFNVVGFMDEKYFVYYDDVDFIYRCNKLGYRILYFPDAKIYHKVSFCTGGNGAFATYYYFRNAIYFAWKNFPFLWKMATFAFIFCRMLLFPFKNTGYTIKRMYHGVWDGIKMISNNCY